MSRSIRNRLAIIAGPRQSVQNKVENLRWQRLGANFWVSTKNDWPHVVGSGGSRCRGEGTF